MKYPRIEDYKVIDKKNRIGNSELYLSNGSHYPVMYVNKQPVWENDEVLFVANNGKTCIRLITRLLRTTMMNNPNIANSYFFDIRQANYNNPLDANNNEIIEKIS